MHTFNAMRQFSHRDPGIVGAVLSDDRIFAEIIADGVHVNPEVVRIFARAKGPARIVLATDATSATGCACTIARNSGRASTAKQAQSRAKALARMQPV